LGGSAFAGKLFEEFFQPLAVKALSMRKAKRTTHYQKQARYSIP
jgi:hypothetical protein